MYFIVSFLSGGQMYKYFFFFFNQLVTQKITNIKEIFFTSDHGKYVENK